MRILQVTGRIPYPLTDGGLIGIFHLTRQLALMGHDVTLACFAEPGATVPAELARYARVEVVHARMANTILGAAGTLFSPVPYTVGKYVTPEMERRLDHLMDSGNFDLVQIEHLHLSHYGVRAKQQRGIAAYLREHNFETAIWERYSQRQRNLLLRLYGFVQLAKVRAYEATMTPWFDCCFMVSQRDANNLSEIAPKARTAVVSPGVDASYFSPGSPEEEERASVLFLGSLDWFPNSDAFEWFIGSMLPLLVSRVPAVKLYVVGKNPPRRIQTFAHPNVQLVGSVDDVRPWMRRAAVAIVPLRVGSGVRIKILELMAMGKAVVSTSIGAEGLDVTNDREILIADDPGRFVDGIVQLLEHPERRSRLGQAGREIVLRRYDWRAVVEKMVAVYEGTAGRRAGALV